MKSLIILTVFCIFTISLIDCEKLIVGDVSKNAILVDHKMVTYHGIPFIKKTKYYFYAEPDNRLIKGIQALDNLEDSKASVAITAGGFGYNYVSIRMESERGKGLDYDIRIYV